ncbi:MAG: iron ABC transporter permease [Endomicrobium sp.]|nr:iron ABC transporter permease [Endomicrobium sp.]
MHIKKKLFVYLFMLALLISFSLFALLNGSIDISFFDILKGLFKNTDDNVTAVIKYIRLPRIIMACSTGAGLAASGCVFQAMLKNPLADPFTLGVSGGAAFGATVAFVSGLSTLSNLFVPFCAFIGAIFSIFIVNYLFNLSKNFDSNSMILSGVVVSCIFSSAIMLMFAFSATNSTYTAFIWLMGSFSMFDERILLIILIVIITGTVVLALFGNIINVITLGNDKPNTIGINVKKNVKFLFLIASIIVAATVSTCGIIGFVGLMIPHIMRKIIGANNTILIPASAVAGANFLLFCDILSRILFSPIVIPIGIITGIIGGFFFVWLLIKSGKSIQK